MPAQRVTPSVTAFSSRAAVQMASAVLAREGRAVVVDLGILPCEAEEPLNDARTRAWAQAGLPAPAPLALPAPTHLAGDGATLPLGPTTLRVHALPGHLGGSIGVELVDEGVVVCGDMLDSVELPLPLQDPRAYLVSLGRLAERLEEVLRFVAREAALQPHDPHRAPVLDVLGPP